MRLILTFLTSAHTCVAFSLVFRVSEIQSNILADWTVLITSFRSNPFILEVSAFGAIGIEGTIAFDAIEITEHT